ncbi:MAG: hypothetical protein ACFFD4_36805 [Candidatus Odinarchaeota archaeon]
MISVIAISSWLRKYPRIYSRRAAKTVKRGRLSFAAIVLVGADRILALTLDRKWLLLNRKEVARLTGVSYSSVKTNEPLVQTLAARLTGSSLTSEIFFPAVSDRRESKLK